jgi:hypothetical protein
MSSISRPSMSHGSPSVTVPTAHLEMKDTGERTMSIEKANSKTIHAITLFLARHKGCGRNS